MDKQTHKPWWRYPIMWLVVGGPLTVVLAALATAVIAVRGADPVLDTRADQEAATQPAIQARNHAATPPARP
ncbi:MAG: nitrogen fixation protein FixH [Rubrivivax sp.]|nr:nitrogen fixation protein FixH [Rubrivivax sp.]MDH5340743.1 nitrogen fixation protein FixH [Rubrivivax sp.]